MPAMDGNDLENGDVLKCHLCHHRVWGTWPFMQAHYREDHGYWPSSWSSLSSSPGLAQSHGEHTPQEENPPPLHVHKPRMRQDRENTNQKDTETDNDQAEHDARNLQTENSLPLHAPRVKTHGERKLVYHEGIGLSGNTNMNTHRASQTTQLYKSVRTTEAWLNEQEPTTSDKGMPKTIQRIGSLNFPPINPGNITQAYHKEYKGQPTANTSAVTTPTSNLDEPQIMSRKALPIEIVTMAVEDMAANMQRDKQLNFATNDNHKTNRNAAPHQSPNKNSGETHTDPSRRACNHTFGGPETGGDHELCGATNGYVPRRIDEQAYPTAQLMAPGGAEYGDQSPQKEPRAEVNCNVRMETDATADAERAIVSAILLGQVNAKGSYNVNGHAASIEDLQERLGNLRDRNQ